MTLKIYNLYVLLYYIFKIDLYLINKHSLIHSFILHYLVLISKNNTKKLKKIKYNFSLLFHQINFYNLHSIRE